MESTPPFQPVLPWPDFVTQLGRCAVDGHSRDSVLAAQDEDLSRWVNHIQSWLDVTPYEHPMRPSALQLLLDLLEKIDGQNLPKFLLMQTDGFLVQEPGVWRSGGSGAVYRGTFKNVAAVIKKVPRNRITSAIREMVIWWQFRNIEPILPFLGMDGHAWFRSEDIAFLTIFAGVSLLEFVLSSPYNVDTAGQHIVPVDPSTVLSAYDPDKHRSYILLHVATGIHFLHSQDIIHGDVTAYNVLIDSGMHVKLCDFGLSAVDIPLGHSTMTLKTKQIGTKNWMSPERFGPNATLRKEADVWAFGCVCYSIYTGRVPYYSMGEEVVPAAITGGIRPEFPVPRDRRVPCIGKNPTSSVCMLVERCWSEQPETRPTISAVMGFFGRHRPSAVPFGAVCHASVKDSYKPKSEEVDYLSLEKGETLLILDMMRGTWFAKTAGGTFGYVHEHCLESPFFFVATTLHATVPLESTVPPELFSTPRWFRIGTRDNKEVAKLPQLMLSEGEEVNVVSVAQGQWTVRSMDGRLGHVDPSNLHIYWPVRSASNTVTGKPAMRFAPADTDIHMMALATVAGDIVYIPRNDDWVIAWKVGSDAPGLIPAACAR